VLSVTRTLIPRAPPPSRQLRVRQDLAALLVVRPVEPHHERHLHLDLLERRDQAACDLVAAGDAAEDVEQHRADLGVGEDHLDCVHDRLGLGAAAGVEEVGRLAARLGHHVEGGHDEPGAVAEDAHVAVELHVGEAALLGHLLLRVLGARVAEGGRVLVAVERIGVHGDLGVQGHDVARSRYQQRVDLHEHGVLGHEHLVQPGQHGPHRPDHVLGDAGLEGQPPAVEVLEPDQRVYMQLDHRVRVLVGDLLDVHAPHPRQHGHGLLGAAVEHDRRVVLLGDVGGLLDVQLVDREPADVHSKDRLGVRFGLLPVARELDPAGLSAAADLHLGLDDDRKPELLGGLHGLLNGGRMAPVRDGNRVLLEQQLALVFEEIHWYFVECAAAARRARTLSNRFHAPSKRHQVRHLRLLRHPDRLGDRRLRRIPEGGRQGRLHDRP
jgi:hypothetical protein